MSVQLPSEEEQKKAIEIATKMALDYIPKLGIPTEQQESALKAYVAGFIAGMGWSAGKGSAGFMSN